MRLRKYIFGAAALALGTGTLVVGLAGSASASVVNPPSVTANGTATCGTAGHSGITGTITFTPPLKNGGTASENTTVSIKEKPCTDTATNLASGGKLKGKVKESLSSLTSTNSCTGLTTSAPETLTIKWSYKNASGVSLDTIANTVISFSGYNIVSSTNPPWATAGDQGFQLPGGTSPTASATGSFLGTDGGASSNAEAFLGLTAAQLASDCASSGGLASSTFAFGDAFVG